MASLWLCYFLVPQKSHPNVHDRQKCTLPPPTSPSPPPPASPLPLKVLYLARLNKNNNNCKGERKDRNKDENPMKQMQQFFYMGIRIERAEDKMNKMRRRMEGNKINWFGDRVCLRLPARVLARQTIVQRDFAAIMPFAASTIVCTRQTEKPILSRV